jgi:hypothetical protein
MRYRMLACSAIAHPRQRAGTLCTMDVREAGARGGKARWRGTTRAQRTAAMRDLGKLGGRAFVAKWGTDPRDRPWWRPRGERIRNNAQIAPGYQK